MGGRGEATANYVTRIRKALGLGDGDGPPPGRATEIHAAAIVVAIDAYLHALGFRLDTADKIAMGDAMATAQHDALMARFRLDTADKIAMGDAMATAQHDALMAIVGRHGSRPRAFEQPEDLDHDD